MNSWGCILPNPDRRIHESVRTKNHPHRNPRRRGVEETRSYIVVSSIQPTDSRDPPNPRSYFGFYESTLVGWLFFS